METFKISLLNSYSKRSKGQTYLAYLLGIGYLIISVYKILNHNYSVFAILWFVLAIVFLFSGFFYSKIADTYFLLLNEEKIHAKDSIFNKFSISWSNVKNIQVKPISILLTKNSGDQKTIHLHNVEYNNLLRIKLKLQEFAKLKDIVIELN